MSRVRIAVIGGGANSEHDVSLASAASVRAALAADRYDIEVLTIGRDGEWVDAVGRPLDRAAVVTVLQSCDVVFPAVHGPRGEDGALAAVLDFVGVPYVGSGLAAGALAMDKWATKLVAEATGVATAGGRLVTAADDPHDADLPGFGMPVIVKPVAGGSSFGVTRVDTREALPAAITTALGFDSRAIIEPLIEGREVDIAVLGRADGSRLLSAPLEIVVDGGVFDTRRKYDGSADLQVPARITPAERAELERSALRVLDAVGCAGVARVDFFLTAGGLVLNEVNTMPGMTGESQVPRMFAAIGISYPRLLDDLVDAALTRR